MPAGSRPDSGGSGRAHYAEPEVLSTDDAAERERRRIGRPSTVERFRDLVAGILAGEPELLSLEILRRARLDGYTVRRARSSPEGRPGSQVQIGAGFSRPKQREVTRRTSPPSPGR